jgi:hypothetical protein
MTIRLDNIDSFPTLLLYAIIYVNHIIIFDYVAVDYCRVVLSGDENEDYINASYIDVS